ncbi:MAG: adenylate/guanylate cyclase domain-containing protein [Dehalococcoidia bacterium]
MEPRIQYAKTSDGVNIAYAVFGVGPAIVFPSSIFGNVHMYKRVSSTFTGPFDDLVSLGWSVITYDSRGTGSSDRDIDDWTLEGRSRDLEAVVERAAPNRFALCGAIQGGPAAIAHAVQHPDRVTHLVLSNTYAAGSDWYELVPAMRVSQQTLASVGDAWEFSTLALASSVTGYTDSERARNFAEAMRAGMAPTAYVAYRDAAERIDVRDLVQQISTPTIVVHDKTWLVDRVGDLARRLAPLIPNARLVETDDFAQVIDEFLREGGLVPTATERKVAATLRQELSSGTAIILFADIADSTALTEQLGDATFRERARELDTSLRALIREHDGIPVEGKLLGDGVLAVFSSARQAIEAAQRCAHAGEAAGLPLHLGVHAGDVIREDNNVYGGAVNIASRIADASAPGEVLVSQTVRDLARTSAGVVFEDHGEQELKGVAEPVRVWAVQV